LLLAPPPHPAVHPVLSSQEEDPSWRELMRFTTTPQQAKYEGSKVSMGETSLGAEYEDKWTVLLQGLDRTIVLVTKDPKV
jgi:hypothetical protein